MKLARQHHSLLAWTLYACVLFNAFACSISHAQMVGLQLSGLSGLFCSIGDTSTPDSSDTSSKNILGASFSCPLCSTITLSLGLLFALGWLLRPSAQRFVARPSDGPPAPRFTWPSANPRASP